jgi:hypothetical protein
MPIAVMTNGEYLWDLPFIAEPNNKTNDFSSMLEGEAGLVYDIYMHILNI